MFTDAMNDALDAHLDRATVKTREQAGRKLSYVEGWFVIAEANRIFGFDGWSRETVDVRMVAERERKIGRAPNQRDGWAVSYSAKVRVVVHGVAREGIGAGHGIDADLGLAHESAVKEAETDAMKRAMMTFGNRFGLALYDKEQSNVSDMQATDILSAADKALVTAAMNGTDALLEAWKKLPPDTRELFGNRAPDRLKKIAADHDARKAA